MPYASNDALPAAVRSKLTVHQQTIFRRVWNETYQRHHSEERAFAYAWAAVNRMADKSWNGEFEVRKLNEEQRIVYGWLMISKTAEGEDYFDLHGDHIPESVMEKALQEYVIESRRGDDMHSIEGTAKLVAAMPFTTELKGALGIADGTVPAGAFVGFRIDSEEVWKRVKAGDRTGFSIGGVARLEDVPDDAET